MSYILKKIGKSTNVPYRTFECDDESDLSAIDVTGAPMGSRCYVINSGKWFALNSVGEWKNIPNSGTGGGDDPSEPDVPQPGDDVIYDGGEEE
jgi:hypothetical protein